MLLSHYNHTSYLINSLLHSEKMQYKMRG